MGTPRGCHNGPEQPPAGWPSTARVVPCVNIYVIGCIDIHVTISVHKGASDFPCQGMFAVFIADSSVSHVTAIATTSSDKFAIISACLCCCLACDLTLRSLVTVWSQRGRIPMYFYRGNSPRNGKYSILETRSSSNLWRQSRSRPINADTLLLDSRLFQAITIFQSRLARKSRKKDQRSQFGARLRRAVWHLISPLDIFQFCAWTQIMSTWGVRKHEPMSRTGNLHVKARQHWR